MNPEWSELTIADVWQDERARLIPLPSPFDGYVEHPVHVFATSLIHYKRNRYSVPCEWVNAVISLRAYHDTLIVLVPDGGKVARNAPSSASNLGDDADTTAAICGQLAGAFYGATSISPHWLELLAMQTEIVAIADPLLLGRVN